MDNKFFHQVRIPRSIMEAETFEKRNLIFRWANRIAEHVGTDDAPVYPFLPQNGQTKIFISGEHRNTELAAKLIRKAVIEICNDTFDPFATEDFMKGEIKAAKELEAVRSAELLKENTRYIPSCRVDFKIAMEDMSRRQSESFDRLQTVFAKMGVNMARVENKPEFIELSCERGEILKFARLTAEWAAKEIASSTKITRNGLENKIREQSVQVFGRSKGAELQEAVFH